MISSQNVLNKEYTLYEPGNLWHHTRQVFRTSHQVSAYKAFTGADGLVFLLCLLAFVSHFVVVEIVYWLWAQRKIW